MLAGWMSQKIQGQIGLERLGHEAIQRLIDPELIMSGTGDQERWNGFRLVLNLDRGRVLRNQLNDVWRIFSGQSMAQIEHPIVDDQAANGRRSLPDRLLW